VIKDRPQAMLVASHSRARKERGAFFTPPAIAEYLAGWAIGANPDARVLDPTCGDGEFMLPAATLLAAAKSSAGGGEGSVVGMDIHEPSLNLAHDRLEA